MLQHSLLTMKLVWLLVALVASTATAFVPTSIAFVRSTPLQAAESEVSFGDLDGTNVRIGIIRTRWNDAYVSQLVDNARAALKECNVTDANIFETAVPGAFELPLAARFLALSGTVDAIICAGVLIKGDTFHFEYISEAVSSGIMSVGLQTSTPVVFGVLTCATEAQVKARTHHGTDYGKTAVEMALLRSEALGAGKKRGGLLEAVGFGAEAANKEEKKGAPGFF